MTSEPDGGEQLNTLKRILVRVPELGDSRLWLDVSSGLHVFYGLNGVGKSRLLRAMVDGEFEIRAALTTSDGRTGNRLWGISPHGWSFGHETEIESVHSSELVAVDETDWIWDELSFISDYTAELKVPGSSTRDLRYDRLYQDEWTRRIAYWVGAVHHLDEPDLQRVVVEAIREILLTGTIRLRRTPLVTLLRESNWQRHSDATGWQVNVHAPIGPEFPATWRYITTAYDHVIRAFPDDEDEWPFQTWQAINQWITFLLQDFVEKAAWEGMEAALESNLDLTGPSLDCLFRRHLPDRHFQGQPPILFIGREEFSVTDLWNRYIKARAQDELTRSDNEEERYRARGTQVDELLLGPINAPSVHPVVDATCRNLTSKADRIFKTIFVSAPQLRVRISEPGEWRHRELVACEIRDTSGTWIPISEASDTQHRLATIAIQLATIEPQSQTIPLLIMDEPERGLHRLAELHLRSGLVQLAKDIPGLVVCVATHSPLFLRPDIASLHHVQRTSDGGVVVNRLTSANVNNARGLGISTTDLLQLTRTVILVEGAHDEWVLNDLFGDEFEELGVRVMSMRGATKLQSAAEGQLLFDYTEANIIVMLDNLSTERCEVAWNNAIDAWNQQQGIAGVSKALESAFPRKLSTESRALIEFCRSAIEHGRRERVSFQMLRKGDIEFYFEPTHFLDAKKFPRGTPSWATLRREHKKYGQSFKAWLESEGLARFNRSNFRRAASSTKRTDSVPDDLLGVLEAVRRIHSLDTR